MVQPNKTVKGGAKSRNKHKVGVFQGEQPTTACVWHLCTIRFSRPPLPREVDMEGGGGLTRNLIPRVRDTTRYNTFSIAFHSTAGYANLGGGEGYGKAHKHQMNLFVMDMHGERGFAARSEGTHG